MSLPPHDYMDILKDLSALKSSYLEAKNTVTKLEKFVALLKEEVKISRDAERTAEYKKSCSQNFASQLQEMVNKLLGVKEENESLKQSLRYVEDSKNDLIQKIKDEQEKKDEEIQELKNNHLKEMLLTKESADEEVLKTKRANEDCISSLNTRCLELKSQINCVKSEKEEIILKLEEKISKQNEKLIALQMENKELKERSANNITIFQKKLLEQQRQYEIELERRNQAEINRLLISQSINSKPSYMNTNFQAPHYSPTVTNQYVTNPAMLHAKPTVNQQQNKPALCITLSKKIPLYQTANELHRKNQKEAVSDENIIEDSGDLNITVNKSKPRIPATMRKRKLYTSNSDWAD